MTDERSCVLLTNGRGVILDVNERTCAMFGYARDELLYSNVAKLLHPDEVKNILRRKECTSLWAAPYGPRKMVRQDGAVIEVEGSGRVIHKNKQMLVLYDAMERKRAEERRKRDEELIRETNKRIIDILESISDSFIVLDREWRFKYVNKRAASLIGFPPSELLEQSIWERFPHLCGTPFEENYRKAMAKRTPVFFEAQTPEGTWIEVRVYPSAEGLTIYASDVTARKRAEERLMFAVESAKMLILEWTNEYGEKRLSTETNGKSGFFPNKGWSSSLDPIYQDDRDRVVEERRRATEKGGDSILEFRLVRPDGSYSWVSDRVRVTHGEGGEVTRITDVFIDITDRKRLEEEVLKRKSDDASDENDDDSDEAA